MRKIINLVILGIIFSACNKQREGIPQVLVFSKTAGFVHSSIPTGIAAIQQLGSQHNINVDTSTNATIFESDSLEKYAAVIFLSTTGNVLDYRQEIAFQRYIQAGGGFVGIHAATDTEYDWGWYGRLVGAYFKSHPRPQEAEFIVEDFNFPATEFLTDKVWLKMDELYNFKKINPDINVIISINEESYTGGENGEFHPMSWYHDYDGGRSFYTAMGHTEETYSDEKFLNHLWGGIKYAIGDNLRLDYDKATAAFPPEEDRFTKVQLTQGTFYEPTEMTILPNLDILIVQRRGEVILFKNETKSIKQVGFLNAYFETDAPGVNAEEGLMGLAKDPDFSNNHWVYIFYSPADSSVNRLSRFTFENDTLDNSTEKVILEVKSQRDICCHTGGSIAFGPDNLLYVSTGDNSTPFNERGAPYVNSGFAPLNDLPGKQQYDARRSSGNTNDLRGKILRIKVNDDGSYDIPKGNLFPPGTDKTRPEIYTMGHRNPYRISVDQMNSTLYWGEVGPDSDNDSLSTRGPRGYDEVNQARQAGNFGWPFFIGNNLAYRQYDYATGESGEAFDPEKPLNQSANNTGLEILPPTQSAFIWYPYGHSNQFPQVGTGGRNAMAGPVYYTELYPDSARLPDYYNGKLIVYEWVRGWMKAVTMLPNGDFDRMEPFLPDFKLNACIDMEVGPDGKIYLLEYGSGWFQRNPDSGLARIDFNAGNRLPAISEISIDHTSGTLPFEVNLSVEANDPEETQMTYVWHLGDETATTNQPQLTHIFDQAGEYNIYVTVTDEAGGMVKSNEISVYAGNTRPVVTIEFREGNKSFYIPGMPTGYAIKVVDENEDIPIEPENLFVSVDFIEGFDQASTTIGHQENIANIAGKNLVNSLDCRSCHKETEASIGPSYLQVAQKYSRESGASNYLVDKIMKGGGGVWGETAMAAHPDLKVSDAHQIVSWIMSLGDKKKSQSLPEVGTIIPPSGLSPQATMVISASYTDPGGFNIKPLTGKTLNSKPGNNRAFTGAEELEGFQGLSFGGNSFLRYPQKTGWFALDNIDLTSIKSIEVITRWREAPNVPLNYELRLDSADGKVLGTGKMPKPITGAQMGIAKINIPSITDGEFHKLYFIYNPVDDSEVQGFVATVKFNAK